MNQTITKRWRPSPLVVVLATATFTLTTLLGIGWLNARRYRVNARVEIAAPVLANAAVKTTAKPTQLALPNGEVERMAVRVREVAGLVYGLTLLAVTEQMQDRRVGNVSTLLQLLAQRNLLPPGMQPQPNAGALTTERATLYVRYRPQPFGLEVVSVGGEALDGPAVIARLTADGGEQTGALLLIAKQNAGVALPAPFASLDQVVALGWQIELLRERASTPNESDQLRQWAKQYASASP